MDELIKQTEELKKKFYRLKTKKAKLKVIEDLREVETKIYRLLDEDLKSYGPCMVEGTVSWFDKIGGTVCIDTPYGTVMSTNTSDINAKSWYESTCCIEYTKGQKVYLEIAFEIDQDAYGIVVVAGKIHGGTVNQARYEELCKNPKLAFFKYPEGMSGLFSREVTK